MFKVGDTVLYNHGREGIPAIQCKVVEEADEEGFYTVQPLNNRIVKWHACYPTKDELESFNGESS
jgi:hypothetical protein